MAVRLAGPAAARRGRARGLAAPAGLPALVGWLGAGAGARSAQRLAERRREADLPRRLDALRSSDLGGLPAAALAALAARRRWVHPRTGEQLVAAGAAQTAVYVVVDGALEARRPGDPAGTIRQQRRHRAASSAWPTR